MHVFVSKALVEPFLLWFHFTGMLFAKRVVTISSVISCESDSPRHILMAVSHVNFTLESMLNELKLISSTHREHNQIMSLSGTEEVKEQLPKHIRDSRR